ncbi:protein kinase [Trypanosoma grayi]|uniref:protein kinase n=1 Tax=Trypanosoma grayi TaxID=71804 RepID=UPI0004F4922C|nr:protein kinase [Trypanosoma grayi]KEG15135.1 protein kinase [Trypanosoma grayi]
MDVPASTVEVTTVLSQCAESKVYECNFYNYRAVCKHRFPKMYRHPVLDHKLREQRTVREARALVRCRKHGVEAPTVFAVDRDRCAIVMERIDGLMVRDVLNNEQGGVSALAERLLRGMGEVVGLLHSADIIHGDLTTSNFMCRGQHLDKEEGREHQQRGQVPQMFVRGLAAGTSCREGLVVLDFGLVVDKNSAEERAVDLYVLERAIKSSHPFLEHVASSLVLDGYHRTIDVHKGAATVARLEAVRARGRKRSMVG